MWLWLFSKFQFHDRSNLIGYLMPFRTEMILFKNKVVYTFPKKVIVIARLEFELAYYNSAVHRLNHYTTRTSFI